MIRLILLDDHALIRRGMRDVLQEEQNLSIVGEAGSQDELMPLLQVTPCDVLVLDINLPGPSGLDILEVLRRDPQAPPALVLSMYPEDQYAVRSLTAGAWGYLNKASASSVLVEAIRTVAQGRKYISPAVATLLVDRLATPNETLPHERLSGIELQTLRLIASGRRLPEIADELKLSAKTVSVYRARLLEKMKLSSNAELAHYAARHALMD